MGSLVGAPRGDLIFGGVLFLDFGFYIVLCGLYQDAPWRPPHTTTALTQHYGWIAR